MSAASSLLRRRTLVVVSALLKHRQREIDSLSATYLGCSRGLRTVATSEHLPFSNVLSQSHSSLGSCTGGYRRFSTRKEGDGPVTPPDLTSFQPGLDKEEDFHKVRIGALIAFTFALRNYLRPRWPAVDDRLFSLHARIAKVSAVAATLAALTWAAYWALEGKSKDFSSLFIKPSEEQQTGGAFQVKDKTSRKIQAVQKIEKPHETQQHTNASTETETKAPEAITAMINMCEETDGKPKVMEESNSMLQVIQGTPLKPKAMEDFELNAHGIEESEFQIKDVEDVEDVKSNVQVNEDNRKFQVSEETEDLPQVSESTTAEIYGDEATITKLLEVKEEDGQSHLYEIVNHVTVTETEPDRPARQSDDDLPLNVTGDISPSSRIEEQEPEQFRKEMQEIAKEEDLKEFSDKVLYNHTLGDGAEKDVCITDETQSSGALEDLREVIAETFGAVKALDQAVKEVGVAAVCPEPPKIMQSLSESYSLSKPERKKAEDSMSQECADGEEKASQHSGGSEDTGAIEEAERRQADADAQFREMLLKLDEEYQQELREARKQQERQAEYTTRLEKDLEKEKERLQAQAKQQLHAAEERLRNELKHKEEEARRELEKMELVTQARTSAAVTLEKARKLEDTKDLQLQVEALHEAFYAQSEGARVSHTTHKLAMGAFALEDAMTRGAPIEKEVQLLRQASGGVGNDELIDIALQSLPEEILKEGTLTQSQLQYEFESMEGPLRQLALIPAGQGGLLTHVLASAVAAIKVREGTGRDGVESLISTVERALVNGQLSEAANILEHGVKGTRAEPFVAEWARQARTRVIAEQASTMVQAHAIATASGLA